MADITEFYGFDFESGYSPFADEFADLPAVFIVYTSKACLEIGETEHLKTTIEEDTHATNWVQLSQGEDIFVAFNLDIDPKSRQDKVRHLKDKMKPLI